MFQKMGDWLSEKSDRLIRGDARTPNSYYASNEAEQAYGQMYSNAADDAEDMQASEQDAARMQGFDPFERSGRDYGGRVPYRSQRDETERQQRIQEEQPYPYAQAETPPTGYGQPAYGSQPQGYPQPAAPQGQPGYATQSYAPYPQQQEVPPQPTVQPQAAPSNVVSFPGGQSTPENGAYTHVEYIVLLRSYNECKKIIEYIRSNASVFLNMEFIANDSERQRCVDMLSGAAYTLRCNLKRISPRGIYLISAPSVYLVTDPAIEKFATTPEVVGFARQSYEGAGMYRQNARQPANPYAASEQDVQAYDAEDSGPLRFRKAPQVTAQEDAYGERGASAGFDGMQNSSMAAVPRYGAQSQMDWSGNTRYRQ